jgi:hypothetical protein
MLLDMLAAIARKWLRGLASIVPSWSCAVLLKPGGGADAPALPPSACLEVVAGPFSPDRQRGMQGRAGRAPPRHDEIEFDMEAA